jgi:hypothetical protein
VPTGPPDAAERPRRLDEVAEDAIQALDYVGENARSVAAPPQGTGTAAHGRLVLTATGSGIATCTADPRWTAEQTGSSLSTALGHALSAARDDLRRAGQQPVPALDPTRLLGEALAFLTDPHRLTEG